VPPARRLCLAGKSGAAAVAAAAAAVELGSQEGRTLPEEAAPAYSRVQVVMHVWRDSNGPVGIRAKGPVRSEEGE
jgi:hypothetical protein